MLALVALGANLSSSLGSPLNTVNHAVARLPRPGTSLVAVSPWYRSAAWPPGSGPDFVNGAAALKTNLSPADLLAHLKQLEVEAGREAGVRWGPRVLDLDLLAMEDHILPDIETHDTWRDLAEDRQHRDTPTDLILPHPRLQDRAFVLIPLCDITPDWRHPCLGRTVREMRDALPSELLSEVTPV
ncbi:2-amino-4-hydroxy-6-hydroxymethyldihydropteridine diphosphokinase [Halovulum sp. GXIMD14793]